MLVLRLLDLTRSSLTSLKSWSCLESSSRVRWQPRWRAHRPGFQRQYSPFHRRTDRTLAMGRSTSSALCVNEGNNGFKYWSSEELMCVHRDVVLCFKSEIYVLLIFICRQLTFGDFHLQSHARPPCCKERCRSGRSTSDPR